MEGFKLIKTVYENNKEIIGVHFKGEESYYLYVNEVRKVFNLPKGSEIQVYSNDFIIKPNIFSPFVAQYISNLDFILNIKVTSVEKSFPTLRISRVVSQEVPTTLISNGKKRSVWDDGDTQVLLELWAERATDLRRTKRNRHIFKEISVQMNHKFSAEEVHIKIRNFTQRYREEKKQMGLSGGSLSKWKFYNAVDRIIGSNASNSAEILESFSFVNIPDESCQSSTEPEPLLSPKSQPLSSPEPDPLPSLVMTSSPSSPLSPLDTTSSLAAAASSSARRKRNHFGEVLNLIKEQNKMLKSVVEDSKSLSNENVKAFKEQIETGKEFVTIMKNLMEKI